MLCHFDHLYDFTDLFPSATTNYGIVASSGHEEPIFNVDNDVDSESKLSVVVFGHESYFL